MAKGQHLPALVVYNNLSPILRCGIASEALRRNLPPSLCGTTLVNKIRFLVEGDATKHFPVKKGVFSEEGGGNSVNEGLGKDFYRKGNSVKRSGPFSEPPDSENWKVAVLIPFPKIGSYCKQDAPTRSPIVGSGGSSWPPWLMAATMPGLLRVFSLKKFHRKW